MSTEGSVETATTAGSESVSATPSSVDTSTGSTTSTTPSTSAAPTGLDAINAKVEAAKTAISTPTAAPVIGAPATATPAPAPYVPNFKYKAAAQEKELDAFWHPLIKDADSEKKVKEAFAKIDAFDYVKGKNAEIQTQMQSLAADYGQTQQVVQRFNESVQRGDLTSAFRLAGVTKEQVFKWTQQELQKMEMSPEQRQQAEQYENAQAQKYDLEDKVSFLQKQYEQQAVTARVMQLDQSLSRPEVARFAQAWDQNSGQEGAFKNFVIEEAKKHFYETKQDISAEQAVSHVMNRFGKFLSVGEPTVQSPQAIPQAQGQRQAPPVIPNVSGKAASPIKKVPRSLDDLKALARSL